MKLAVAVLSLASLLAARTSAGAGPSAPWTLPRDREVYLMEDDLVYVRFLMLARDGTYSQINRDEHGSTEVDRGNWRQDAAGGVRLRSSCRALRPRAVFGGPLSVTLADERAFEGLPALLASVQRFLADNRDAVFGAETLPEVNAAGAPVVHIDRAAASFERRDVVVLSFRLEAALAGERDAAYLLEPVKTSPTAAFALQGSVFGPADLAGVRRNDQVAARAVPPFYFVRVEAKTYAREVGRWQPLHLPGGAQ